MRFWGWGTKGWWRCRRNCCTWWIMLTHKWKGSSRYWHRVTIHWLRFVRWSFVLSFAWFHYRFGFKFWMPSWPISQFLRSDIPSRIYNFFKSLPLTKAELDFPSEINNFFTMPPTIEEHMSWQILQRRLLCLCFFV